MCWPFVCISWELVLVHLSFRNALSFSNSFFIFWVNILYGVCNAHGSNCILVVDCNDWCYMLYSSAQNWSQSALNILVLFRFSSLSNYLLKAFYMCGSLSISAFAWCRFSIASDFGLLLCLSLCCTTIKSWKYFIFYYSIFEIKGLFHFLDFSFNVDW